jgi:hypothetical protein
MAINAVPCGHCKNYDPILGSGEKETRRGWCVPRSKYAHREGPGQVFPAGVQRVGPKELAQPFIVKKDYTHPTCELARSSALDAVEEKKKKQIAATTPTKNGRRVHT